MDIVSSVYLGITSAGVSNTLSHRHSLSGVIMVEGNPARRVVAVFDRESLTLVAATYSNELTGKWEIKGVPEYPVMGLLVIAIDNTGNYNSQLLDYVSQGVPQ